MTQLISKPHPVYKLYIVNKNGVGLAYINEKDEIVFTSDATIDGFDDIYTAGNITLECVILLLKEVFRLRYVEPVE